MSNLDNKIQVHIAKVDSIVLYEVTDQELQNLEAGSQESLFLNLCISFASISASGLLSLLTATFNTSASYTIAIVVTTASLIASVVFLLIWRAFKASSQNIFLRIRSRFSSPITSPALDGAIQDPNSSEE